MCGEKKLFWIKVHHHHHHHLIMALWFQYLTVQSDVWLRGGKVKSDLRKKVIIARSVELKVLCDLSMDLLLEVVHWLKVYIFCDCWTQKWWLVFIRAVPNILCVCMYIYIYVCHHMDHLSSLPSHFMTNLPYQKKANFPLALLSYFIRGIIIKQPEYCTLPVR